MQEITLLFKRFGVQVKDWQNFKNKTKNVYMMDLYFSDTKILINYLIDLNFFKSVKKNITIFNNIFRILKFNATPFNF